MKVYKKESIQIFSHMETHFKDEISAKLYLNRESLFEKN